MKFNLKKIYSKLYGIDIEILGKAAKFKAAFKWVMVSYAFAQNAIDTIFLKKLGPEFLPVSYLFMPIFIIIISSIFSFFSAKINKRKFLIYFLYISSIFFIFLRASLYMQLPQTHKIITITAYIFMETFNTFFLIAFYTTVNEEMTSKERKKSIPFILMGGIAAIGTTNLVILFFSKFIFVNVVDYLLIAAFFNLVAIIYLNKIPISSLKSFINESKFFNFKSKKFKKEIQNISSIKSSYVRKLIFTMFLSFVLLVLVDFQFKYNLAKYKMTERDLSEFLGLFRGISHYIMVIFQTFLFARIIPKIGTINIFSIYPFTLLINGIVLLFTKSFYGSLFTKLFQEVFKKMFEEPAVQFAYNPIPYLKKGYIISFVEGILKHFTLFFIGFVLIYLQKLHLITPITQNQSNGDISLIYYLIVIISVLYFLMAFWLRSGYYNAFLQKIKTEKKIFNKFYQLDNVEILNDLDFSKYNNGEIVLYAILKSNKKIPIKQLVDFISQYKNLYEEQLIQYMVKNYDIDEIFSIITYFNLPMKKELFLYLFRKNLLKNDYKQYFHDLKENIDNFPFHIEKLIYKYLVNDNYSYKSLSSYLKILSEKPYAISKIVTKIQEIPLKKIHIPRLLFLFQIYKFNELYDYLMDYFDLFTIRQRYDIILYGIKNQLITKKKLNTINLIPILENQINIIIYIYNQYVDNKNSHFASIYLEYLRLIIIDFLYLLVFVNFNKNISEVMLNVNSSSEYISAEIIAYLEDVSRKAQKKYQNFFKMGILILDNTYKNNMKKITLLNKPVFNCREKAFLKLPLNKGELFMKDIIENLLLLKNVELFNEINIFQLETLVGLAKEKNFKKDEIIIKEGDLGKNLYIIKKGSAEVIKTVGFIQTSIKKLKKGDWFGEFSILAEEKHLASVKALTPLETVVIPATAFRIFIYNNPELSFKIFEILISYIKNNNKGEIG